MKATDLMIGDYIQDLAGDLCQVIVIDRQVAQVETLTGVHQGDTTRYLHEAEGVPLTPEILEKNGWKIAGTNKSKYYWHEEVPFCLPICGFEYSNGRNVSLDKLFADDFFETVNMRLSFVHELQHAIKLFGIDKEIVL